MAATTLRSLMVELGLDSGPFQAGLRSISQAGAATMKPMATATKEVDDSLKHATETTNQAGTGFSKLKTIGTGALLGIGIAAGQMATNLVKNFAFQLPMMALAKLGDAVDLASDKAENASKVQVLFGESSGIVEKASLSAATTVGMSSGKYLEMAGTLGNLVTNFGVTGDAAAGMSVDMIQLAADMGSFNNAEPTDVVYAMGAAFRGETEPIRKYGVMLSQAAVQEKALEMGLITAGEALDKTSKFQATYALILDQTTAAQGDFARTAAGYANQQRILAAQQEEAWTRLGEVIKPIALFITQAMSAIIVAIVGTVTEVANAFKSWIDNNQQLVSTVSELAGVILNVLGKAFDFLVSIVGTAIDVTSKLISLALGPLLPLTIAIAGAMTAQLIPALLKTALTIGGNLYAKILVFALTMKEQLVPAMGDFSMSLGGVGKGLGGLASGIAAAIGPQLLLTAAMAAAVLVIMKLSEAWDAANAYATDLIHSQSELTDGLLQQNEVASVTAKTQAQLNDDMATATEAIQNQTGAAAELQKPFYNLALQLAGFMNQQALNNQLAYEAANANAVQEDSIGQVEEALRALGPTFELTDQNAADLARSMGTNVETIQAAWSQLAVDSEEDAQRIGSALAALPPDFQMTQAAAITMADSMGVASQDIIDAFNAMQSNSTTQSAAMVAALGALPPEFQQFAIDSGLSLDQINAMITNMPTVWGPALVELNAALDKLPPELRSVAEQAGLSVDQINDWVATLPPQAKSSASGVEESMAKIQGALKDTSDSLGGLVGSSDAAWKDFKKSFKDGGEDVEARIKKLKERIVELDKVDLASLGPSALANWSAAKLATSQELGGLTNFVDNKSTLIAGMMPDALSASNQGVSAEYAKLQGNSVKAWSSVQTTAENSSDATAAALPNELQSEQGRLNLMYSQLGRTASTTYSGVTTNAQTNSNSTAAALPNALNAQQGAVSGAMNTMSGTLNSSYGKMESSARTSGDNIGDAFAHALNDAIRAGQQMIANAVNFITAPFQSHSPPKVGPLAGSALKNWGTGIAGLWIGPLIARLAKGQTEVASILQGYFAGAGESLTGVDLRGVLARPLGGAAGFPSTTATSGGIRVEKQEFNIHGQTPEETERAVETGMRRAALELSLS